MEVFALVGFISGMAGFSFAIVAFTTAISSIKNGKELEKRVVELEGKL
ncbi:hypothetical protein [Metaplanococcus flavidus]|uniref:Uncharacterized protein n=1 Tax=Metaplanococcus flavidus TaxID=569883 RepID=A0ABW3L807_9BACL